MIKIIRKALGIICMLPLIVFITAILAYPIVAVFMNKAGILEQVMFAVEMMVLFIVLFLFGRDYLYKDF